MSYSSAPRSSRRSRVAARPQPPIAPARKQAGTTAPQPLQKKRTQKVQPQKGQLKKIAVRKALPQKVPTQKAILASGSIAALALLVILPGGVGSQSVPQTDCLEVVRSGAEMSRRQLSQLIAMPAGSSQEAVRQVTDVPYCVLPAGTAGEKAAPKADDPIAQAGRREAYPLAFDLDTWVVVAYEANSYVGYDFVFKQ